jgi:hypothetical protein
MKRPRAMEPPADRRVIAAANEDFNELVSAARDVARDNSGWDPYEVWLTRVRMPAQLKQERTHVSEGGQ